MAWNWTSFAILYLISAVGAAVTAIFIWQRRRQRGGLDLALSMAAVSWWAFTNGLEAAAVDLNFKITLSKLAYLGIYVSILLLIFFAMEYAQQTRWLHPRIKVFLAAPFLVSLLMVMTNECHHLIWRSFTPFSDPAANAYVYEPGLYYWVGWAYSNLLVVMAAITLIQIGIRYRYIYRSQTLIIIFSILPPWVINTLYVLRLSPLPGLDLTPIGFTFTGLLLTLGIYRFRLFDLLPITADMLFEKIGDPIMVLDVQLRVVDANPAAWQMLQCTEKDMIGQMASQVFAQWEALAAFIARRNSEDAQLEFSWSGEPALIIEARAAVLFDHRRNLSGWILTLRDITQRKIIENNLRQSEARYQAIVEGHTDLVSRWLPDTTLTFVNQPYCDYFSTTREQAIGHKFAEDLPAETQSLIFETIEKLISGKEDIITQEELNWAPDGQPRWVVWTYKPICNEAGSIIEFQSAGRDVTARKATEEALHEQQQLADAMRESIAALNQSLKLDDVLDQILINLAKVMQYDLSDVILIDENGMAQVAHRRRLSSGAEEVDHPLNLKVSETHNLNQMFTTRQPVLIPNILKEPTWVHTESSSWLRSYLGAPICIKDKVVGFINLASGTLNFFQPHHIERLKSFAEQVSMAIEKASLYEETQRQLKEQSILNEVLQIVSASLNQEETFARIFEQVGRFIEYQILILASYDASKGQLVGMIKPYNGEPYHYTINQSEGIAGFVAMTGEGLFLRNTQEVMRFLHSSDRQSLISVPRSIMVTPLVVKDHLIGVMGTQHDEKENAYTPADFELFRKIGLQVAVALENARLFTMTERLAITDALTGLSNRRYYFEASLIEVERAMRNSTPLSIIMIDLDHFKRVNDHYGHPAGDRVLQNIANVCRLSLRRQDLIGRYGGEELVITLPGADLEQACEVAERIRALVAATVTETPRGDIRITASLGAATLNEQCSNLESLLECADRALYLAKESGRNRVVVFQENPPPLMLPSADELDD